MFARPLSLPPALPPALATIAVVALVLGPALGAPTELAVGSACSEAPNHLWMIWASAESLPQTGPFVMQADVAFPDGWKQHLMDPLSLVVYAPVYWLAGTGRAAAFLAWNALHAAAVVIGAVGMARLVTQQLGARLPWVQAAAIVAFAGASFHIGVPHTGRTEYLAACVVPWHLLWLYRAVQPGARWRDAIGAGALLGAVVLGGWYLGVFTLWLTVGLSVYWGLRAGVRHALPRLVVAALCSVVMVLPALWAVIAYPPAQMDVGDVSPLPDMGTDMSFALRAHLRMAADGLAHGPDLAGYPGLVTLGLAVLGAAVAPRAALPWLVLGLGYLAVAPGPFIADGDTATHRLPAWYVEYLLPPVRKITCWARVGAVMGLPLGLAAAWGARWILARRGGAAVVAVLAVLALADQASWPRPYAPDSRTMDLRAPPELVDHLAQLPEGAVLHYPLDPRSDGPTCEIYSRYLLWQLEYDRPTSASRGIADEMTESTSRLTKYVRALQRDQGDISDGAPAEAPSMRQDVDPTEYARCLINAVDILRRQGFTAIVLDHTQPDSGPLSDMLQTMLGPPHFTGPTVSTWGLADLRINPVKLGCRGPAAGAKAPGADGG